jgi:endogenous inhibitor of DNA gyrase (YacG/DUF329 family)
MMAVRPTTSKTTLFCPECPHRSHIDGDWHRVESDAGRRVVCPDCRATVTWESRARYRSRSSRDRSGEPSRDAACPGQDS